MMPGYCPTRPRRPRPPRRAAVPGLIVLLLWLLASACSPISREKKQQERPSGQQVAEQAGKSAGQADIDALVLYSSSIDDADAGANDGDVVDSRLAPQDQADAGAPLSADETADADTVPQPAPDTEQ